MGDCLEIIKNYDGRSFDLTFLDPPFNQHKEYRSYNDSVQGDVYWGWIKDISGEIYKKTSDGGAIYFMQREKNAHKVISTLLNTGWNVENLIIWKKKTSAVPIASKFGKHYQITSYAIKGKKPRVFNKLRVDLPLSLTQKIERPSGVYVTDVWDDILELTSGYFAGNEPLRLESGERFHKQQSPIHLLLRIILSSTKVGDLVFDPFAGTGTTAVVASQLNRDSFCLEVDSINFQAATNRLNNRRMEDSIGKYYNYYRFTENLPIICGVEKEDHDGSIPEDKKYLPDRGE